MREEMAEEGLTLVIGGARSGKSGFALSLAEDASVRGPRVYLATASALDDEMRARIKRHREERSPLWTTVEEPTDPASVLGAYGPGGVVLIDCLTLWVTNLMEAGLGDGDIMERVDELARLSSEQGSAVIAVSNEVGCGIMPVNAMARRFGDLSGFMNQRMARAATRVYRLTAGLAVRLK
jgi:adenosylcobinamide kinase/adenosylcobinamide-phosphate guanylyltransferase